MDHTGRALSGGGIAWAERYLWGWLDVWIGACVGERNGPHGTSSVGRRNRMGGAIPLGMVGCVDRCLRWRTQWTTRDELCREDESHGRSDTFGDGWMCG